MIEVKKFPMIYPPRPEGAIRPETVESYTGFVGQYKYNDIRILIYIHPDQSIQVLSRKREPVLTFKPDEIFRSAILSLKLKPGEFHLLDGGLMRKPLAPSGRRAIVLWDILIHDSKYLLGTTYAERYKILSQLCGNPKTLETDSGHQLGYGVSPGLWLAPIFKSKLSSVFNDTIQQEELEGIMLKKPGGKLGWGLSEENNGDWQIRVRKKNGRHLF